MDSCLIYDMESRKEKISKKNEQQKASCSEETVQVTVHGGSVEGGRKSVVGKIHDTGRRVKERDRVMDDESDESTEKDDVTGVERAEESQTERLR